MNEQDRRDWENEVSDPLQATLERVRSRRVPDESVERSLTAAEMIDDLQPEPGVNRRPDATQRSGSRSFSRPLTALAVGVLVAVPTAWVLLSESSAWGQVVKAISGRSWMCLTLQTTEQPLPEGEELPKIVMWFSGDRRIAAMERPDAVLWSQFAKGDSWRFDRKAKTLRRSSAQSHDAEHVQLLTNMLFHLKPTVAGADVELSKSKKGRVERDGRDWDLFSFDYEVTSGETTYHEKYWLRVDTETHLPVELKRQIVHDDEGSPIAIFAVTYPDIGPIDIYALGVPKDLQVVDTRSMKKYFQPRKRQPVGEYKATVLRFHAGTPGWMIETERHQYNAAGLLAERGDIEAVSELTDRVYRKGYGPSKTPPTAWWVEEVNQRMKFEVFHPTEPNLMPNRCYLAYGGESDYETIRLSDGRIKGLEHTIELRGPKLGVWLDPERDLIVRRYEYIEEDSIDVTQFDEVVQGPCGNWFPVRWRRGCVEERGALLGDKQPVDGITMSLFIADIQFPEHPEGSRSSEE
jgi:hypothetical protein